MVSRVSYILDIDVEKFLSSYLEFLNLDNQKLKDFYSNKITYPKGSFDSLKNLLNLSSLLYQKIKEKRDLLTDFSDFEVILSVEEAIHGLNIINNYSRWMRSTVVNDKYIPSESQEYFLKQNQNIEDLTKSLGYDDIETSSINIMLQNNLKEEDYSLNGGRSVTVNLKSSRESYNNITIKTVIDQMIGLNVLGKDISKKLNFVNNDLETLDPENTFYQSCGILLDLKKGGNPEFYNYGFDKSMLVNRNLVIGMLPSFLRQLNYMVSRDDTIQSYILRNFNITGDKILIKIEFISVINSITTEVTK